MAMRNGIGIGRATTRISEKAAHIGFCQKRDARTEPDSGLSLCPKVLRLKHKSLVSHKGDLGRARDGLHPKLES
jgi:hypothetical protein